MDVNQHYLYEARQMQALSLAVHIPLVCFGIAFPVLVLFAEWRYLRTGDSLYRVLAKRWSRIMLALFAVGWERLRPRFHFACGIPVAIAAGDAAGTSARHCRCR